MIRFALLPALLFAICGTVAHSETVRAGGGFEVERYSVSLRPDLATTVISGRETIVVRSTSAQLKRLSFSANALRISAATVDGRSVAVASTKDAIVFSLPRELRNGDKATLRFRINGKPARGISATAGGLYTSYFACDWMVCLQDAPGDKAHLDLDLMLPAGLLSVGVGRGKPLSPLPNDLVLHRWRSTRPYSPYLYAFAAGPFPRHATRTRQGDHIYIDATGANADLSGLFAATPAIANFFSGKAGMALPDGRYVQILVPGLAAQEAASLALIGKAELDRERGDPSSAWIIAHELAHQWWGNLVTCATWQDFWLNEGIATFMVAAWKEHSEGRDAYRRELEVARRRLERAREIGFDKPLAWAGEYPTITTRRAVQYSKGALFFDHLRQSIGDAAFWKGLRLFTRRHAGGTVTSKDFQSAMERTSGRDLSAMFVEWVYGA